MPDRRAQLEEKIRAFQEQAARAGQLKEKISELRGQARSGDGSVTVTVAPSGAVLGLQLSPNAMKYSHTQLQQEILATIRAATQQAAQMLQDTVVPVLGDQAERFKEAFNAHSSVMMPDAPPQTMPPQHAPPQNYATAADGTPAVHGTTAASSECVEARTGEPSEARAGLRRRRLRRQLDPEVMGA